MAGVLLNISLLKLWSVLLMYMNSTYVHCTTGGFYLIYTEAAVTSQRYFLRCCIDFKRDGRKFAGHVIKAQVLGSWKGCLYTGKLSSGARVDTAHNPPTFSVELPQILYTSQCKLRIITESGPQPDLKTRYLFFKHAMLITNPVQISTMRHFIRIQTDSCDVSVWCCTKTLSHLLHCLLDLSDMFVCLFVWRFLGRGIKLRIRVASKVVGFTDSRYTLGSSAGAASLFHAWQWSFCRYHLQARNNKRGSRNQNKRLVSRL